MPRVVHILGDLAAWMVEQHCADRHGNLLRRDTPIPSRIRLRLCLMTDRAHTTTANPPPSTLAGKTNQIPGSQPTCYAPADVRIIGALASFGRPVATIIKFWRTAARGASTSCLEKRTIIIKRFCYVVHSCTLTVTASFPSVDSQVLQHLRARYQHHRVATSLHIQACCPSVEHFACVPPLPCRAYTIPGDPPSQRRVARQDC